MTIPTLRGALALAAGAVLFAAAPAEAQIGALKNKLKEKVQGEAQAAAPATAAVQKPVYTADVLQITPAVLDQLRRGLAARAEYRTGIERHRAALKTPTEYQACMMTWVETPEYTKIMERYSAAAETGDMEAVQKIAGEMQKAMEASCGMDPGSADSHFRALEDSAAAVGIAASGLTPAQYGMVQERVIPLCQLQAAEGEVRIHTYGPNYYVYGEDEVATIRPHCGALLEGLAEEFETWAVKSGG